MILAALAITGAIEMYGVFHPGEDYTISELLRAGFHTNTKLGKIVFSASVIALGGWLLPHINDGTD